MAVNNITLGSHLRDDGTLEPQLSEVNQLYFNGQVLSLDGYKFKGCRFDRCELHVQTPYFSLEQCVIDDSCTIKFGKDVAKLVKLFNSRNEWAYKLYQDLTPEQHSNGTISIKG